MEYEREINKGDGYTELKLKDKGVVKCSGRLMKDGNISTNGNDPECVRQLKKEMDSLE